MKAFKLFSLLAISLIVIQSCNDTPTVKPINKFEYQGSRTPSIKKERLTNVKFMNEIIPYYPPAKWIVSYISAEISATCNGKAMKAVSPNDTLSAEQQNILNTVDLSTDIQINIFFKYRNSATEKIEIDSMHYSATVVPETEAEYPGGFKQVTEYLIKNIFNKISKGSTSGNIRQAIVKFTVNEEGQIVNAKIFKTSTDPTTDHLILEAINKMPKWSPAKDSKGIKVKQEFSIPFRNGGC